MYVHWASSILAVSHDSLARFRTSAGTTEKGFLATSPVAGSYTCSSCLSTCRHDMAFCRMSGGMVGTRVHMFFGLCCRDALSRTNTPDQKASRTKKNS